LRGGNSTIFSSVTVSTVLNVESVQVVFVKSAFPTSQPTSSPTTIWESERLVHVKAAATSTSQFAWLIGLCVSVFFGLPWAIHVYRKRGLEKQIEKALKINRMKFEAKKNRLSEFELRRREEIRSAFRKKFGRDINVYGDCMEKPENIYLNEDVRDFQLPSEMIERPKSDIKESVKAAAGDEFNSALQRREVNLSELRPSIIRAFRRPLPPLQSLGQDIDVKDPHEVPNLVVALPDEDDDEELGMVRPMKAFHNRSSKFKGGSFNNPRSFASGMAPNEAVSEAPPFSDKFYDYL
jgi:hypothetical protein